MTGNVDGAPLAIVAVNLDSSNHVIWADGHLPKPPVKIVTDRGELWCYRHPGPDIRVPTGSKLRGAPITIVGDHEQIVVPPSMHSGGHQYSMTGSWHVLRDSEPFDPALIAPRVSNHETFADIVGNLPKTKEAFGWLGCYAYRQGITQSIREQINDPAMLEHYDSGSQVAGLGHRVAKPEDVPDAVRKRLERALKEPAKSKVVVVEEMEFRVSKLVRRPIIDRSHFEITLIGNMSDAVTIRIPDGRTLNSYALMRGLATEAGFFMPPASQSSNRGWAEALKEAWPRMEVRPIDPEEAAATACREIIYREVYNAGAELATTKADMEIGKLARFGDFMAIVPEILIKAVRKHLHEDNLDRPTITRAADSVGRREIWGEFPDGKVRVWAFPMTREDEGPEHDNTAADPNQGTLVDPTSSRPAV